jgi:signal transduction histidine kinase
MTQGILDRLQERLKELTALHQTARILQAGEKPTREVMEQIVQILPAAWQYPSVTEARIQFRGLVIATPRFAITPWMQSAVIAVRRGQQGLVEIAYREERPFCDEGPFLAEERDLIDSLAEMLRSYFQHMLADEELQEARSSLEQQVQARTEELALANEQLARQLAEQAEAQARIERYQLQLRQLAAQLAAVQARERRAIALDLHEHIGQALAFIRLHIARLQTNATFCGFESEIADTLVLLNQTIRYTRDMTSQISPPVLYELGLSPALRWLAESFRAQHKLAVKVEAPAHRPLEDALSATIFKAVQELLTNVVKHAGAQEVLVRLDIQDACLCVEVTDDGAGFEVARLDITESLSDHFGLFSIREQIRNLGGDMTIMSSPGRGTRVTLRLPC